MDYSKPIETFAESETEEEIKLRLLLKRLFKPYCIRFDIELWNHKTVLINQKRFNAMKPSFVLKLLNPRVLHAIINLNEYFDFEEALEAQDIDIIGEMKDVVALGKHRLQRNKPLRMEICHTINQLRLKRLNEHAD